MDVPTTVKNNAMLLIHSYCKTNEEKILQELENSGEQKLMQEFKFVVNNMQEPAASKPQ